MIRIMNSGEGKGAVPMDERFVPLDALDAALSAALDAAPTLAHKQEVTFYALREALRPTRARSLAEELLAACPAPTPGTQYWYVAHPWVLPVVELQKVLRKHAEDRGCQPHEVRYWVYAANFDSGAAAEQEGGPPAEWVFARATRRATGTVAVIDREGAFFRRAWCLAEVHAAVALPDAAHLLDVYTAKPRSGPTEPVGLVDGLAARDWSAAGKAEREHRFPANLVLAGLATRAAHADATAPVSAGTLLGVPEAAAAEAARSVASTFARLGLSMALEATNATKMPFPILAGRVPGSPLRTSFALLRESQVRRVEAECITDKPQLAKSVARRLGAALPRGLEVLSLTNMDAAVAHGALALAAGGGGGNLRTLKLSKVWLSVAQVKHLAAALVAPSTRVASLDLSFCKLTGKHAQALASGLLNNTSLTILKLLNNPLRDEGIAALSDWLSQGRAQLTVLDVRYTGMTAAGARTLADAVQHAPALRTFIVGGNSLSALEPSDMKAFLAHPNVLSLDLGHCEIKPEALQELLQLVRTNKVLTTLDLRQNAIDASMQTHLVAALSSNATLETLELRGNMIDEAMREQLNAAWRRTAHRRSGPVVEPGSAHAVTGLLV